MIKLNGAGDEAGRVLYVNPCTILWVEAPEPGYDAPETGACVVFAIAEDGGSDLYLAVRETVETVIGMIGAWA